MVMMIQGGVHAQLNEFYDFVKLLSDKDATQATLQALKDAADAAAKLQAEASAKDKANFDKEQGLSQLGSELEKREAAVKIAEDKHNARERGLDQRETALVSASAALARDRVQYQKDRDADSAEAGKKAADAAAAALASKKIADERAAALDGHEASLKQREADLGAKLADYANRLAALKKLAGG